MSTITALHGHPGVAAPPKAPAKAGDGDTFAAMLAAASPSAVTPAVSAGAATTSAGVPAGLLQLQAAGGADATGAVTALSGLGGRIDPTQERQFMQGWGADFAHAMDSNGDGQVTRQELVGTLNAKGGLSTDLGERLFDTLAPGGGDTLSVGDLADAVANGSKPASGAAT